MTVDDLSASAALSPRGGLDGRAAALGAQSERTRLTPVRFAVILSNSRPETDVLKPQGAAEASDDEYEVLFPSEAAARRILEASEFYGRAMPRGDALSDALLGFCGSFAVREGPRVGAALVRRFTDARFNWRNKTLQSFLELTCWLSVSGAAYSLYGDALFAVQVGTFVGAVMSVCDEVALQFVRGLARVIRNQPGGSRLLERLGFDVPTDGKAPTDGQEIVLIKNLVFGYLGVVAVRYLWENMRDVPHFAALTACTGVAFVVTAEFFCLWLPTRRVGLTLQSRFTRIRENWREHFYRSLVEVLCWTLATLYFFVSRHDFLSALQLGTLVAVCVSLTSGLEDLPDIVSSDDLKAQRGEYSYWQEHAGGDAFMGVASALVAVQNAFGRAFQAIEDEAMNMYENFGE